MELRQSVRIVILCAVLCAAFGVVAFAQNDPTHRPRFDYFPHNNGNMQMWISNLGTYGDGGEDEQFYVDPLSGQSLPFTFVYPRNSHVVFGVFDLWIGGKVSGEPSVSQGYWGELVSDYSLANPMSISTIDPTKAWYSPQARSELDINCEYTDTFPRRQPFPVGDPNDPLIHPPLGVRVHQRSMSWSAETVNDFILIDLVFTNIGRDGIKDVYVGISGTSTFAAYIESYADFDTLPHQDDLAGYLRSMILPGDCNEPTELGVAYIMDNDGDPEAGVFDAKSALPAVGTIVLRCPGDTPTVSFNWWAWLQNYGQPVREDWGPMHERREGEPRPPVGMGTEYPYGDIQRYYIMSRPEIDYDQVYAAILQQGWMLPARHADEVAAGSGVAMLHSAGPFDLFPGQSAEFTFAFVGGENVHTDPTNFERNFIPSNPSAYLANLDFSDLALNARWAQWVYDNPGFDTDGDGYRGEYRICDGDTLWYQGDGIPDFRADVPPPAPLLHVYPSQGKLVYRWNGYNSETFVDPFTRIKDFEGYRVYMGLDQRESSLSMISQFDYPNFNRFVMRQKLNGTWDWQNKDLPLSLDSLRKFFNDPEFEPSLYPRTDPLKFLDTFYYFQTQSYNAALAPDQVHKVYPDAIKPPDDTLQWTADMLTEEHGKPLPRYYEYEYVLDKLLPTIEYYASVTAFDFGFAFGGIPSREASKYANITNAYAIPSAQTVASEHRDVYIWPNPYRYDGNYLEQGFENHDQSLWYDRARRIHFGNLPAKCTISILSLDGDLIKEIHHSFAPDDPEAQHDSFDLISRAGLLVVSGIYYWVVEGDGRTQMGKLVIIE